MKVVFWFSILCLLASLGGIVSHSQMATEAYFSSWTFWFQFPVGALFILLLHNLTGGNWGDAARPFFNPMAKSFYLLILFFVPMFFKTHDLYPWLKHVEAIKINPILTFKAPFYRQTFFIIRSLIYFLLIFISLKLALRKSHKATYSSAWGLILLVFIMSFLTMDFYMSRDPEWVSSIYSFIWISSETVCALGLLFVLQLNKVQRITNTDALKDLGNLFFVFIIMWLYVALMQYLIMWSANLPKEVYWYVDRFKNGWDKIIIAVVLGSFVIPFFFLLGQNFKRSKTKLALLSIVVLIFRYLDVIWTLRSTAYPLFVFSVWDVLSFIGIGGLTISVYFHHLHPEYDDE